MLLYVSVFFNFFLQLHRLCCKAKYISNFLILVSFYFFLSTVYIHHFFQKNLISDNFTKCTRSQSKFYPSFCRFNITKQSLRYGGPLAWNKVPSSTKQIKSYSKFRTEFQKHLIAT